MDKKKPKRSREPGGSREGGKRRVIEVIDLDSDEIDQRMEKTPTEKKSISLEEKSVFLEQIKKLEDRFQRACRAAREAELRAERAEERLDSKIGVRESLHVVSAVGEDQPDASTREDERRSETASALSHGSIGSADGERLDQLEKRLDEVTRGSAANGNEDKERVNRLEKMMIALLTGLQTDRATADKERVRLEKRIEELEDRVRRLRKGAAAAVLPLPAPPLPPPLYPTLMQSPSRHAPSAPAEKTSRRRRKKKKEKKEDAVKHGKHTSSRRIEYRMDGVAAHGGSAGSAPILPQPISAPTASLLPIASNPQQSLPRAAASLAHESEAVVASAESVHEERQGREAAPTETAASEKGVQQLEDTTPLHIMACNDPTHAKALSSKLSELKWLWESLPSAGQQLLREDPTFRSQRIHCSVCPSKRLFVGQLFGHCASLGHFFQMEATGAHICLPSWRYWNARLREIKKSRIEKD